VSLRKVVAAPFLRRDVEEVTRAEFIYSLTGDLGWFEPDEAEEVLVAGTEEGILNEDGGGLEPAFDVGETVIPEGFEPSVEFNRREEKDVFERAVGRLVGAGYDRREAVAEINRVHAGMDGTRIEAAALLTAKMERLEVADLAEEALEEIRS
jgi:hypothetical protein